MMLLLGELSAEGSPDSANSLKYGISARPMITPVASLEMLGYRFHGKQ